MADLFRKVVDPFVRRNRWTPKQQQTHYKRVFNTWDHQGDKYDRQYIPGATDMEDVTTVSAADFQRQAGQWNQYVHHAEPGKLNRLKVWRDMSFFAEIAFALGEMSDEGIATDTNGNVLSLDITNPRLLQNENIVANLIKEWKYIDKDVLKSNENIDEWFYEFLVDGEIYFEKVIDPLTAKERGILRVKRLRPEFTYPIWEEIESDQVYQYIHKNHTNILIMPTELVAYANSGLYVYEDQYTKTVLSFLEKAKIDYRKLKQMEDALIIYRLVRAPERRVFTIEVGKLPKQKAEAYVQSLMRKYRQRKTFNPQTGEAGETYDPQAMIEDFFFPQQDGKGSNVTTLPGGENLGQMDDVLLFLKKLYRSLRIPMSRMEQDSGFSIGDTSDITREEVRFNKMVTKQTNRFATVFKQIFLSHLRLKGYADEYGISEKDFNIKINSDNAFKEYVESNIATIRGENFERLVQYAEPDEVTGVPLFSKRWLQKRYLKHTAEEMQENQEYIEQDKLLAEKNGAEGGGDSGGDGGSRGLDMGGLDSGSDKETDTGGADSKEQPPSEKDIESFA